MSRARKSKTEEYLSIVSAGVADMVTVDDMREESIVPTILTGYNRATGIGGQPNGCVTVIQGPNQVGKSVLGLALVESLRRRGCPSVVFDAEFAGEREWYGAITPRSGYKPIGNLNELISNIQEMQNNLVAAKKKKIIPEDIGNVYLIDTLTELMPADMLEQVKKEGPHKVYPMQAMMLSLWLKSIIQQLYWTHSTVIAIVQERDNVNKKNVWDLDYKPAGGRAIQYNNRLRARVRSSKRITRGDRVVGMQCRYAIENNKIVGTTFSTSSLFTSNGEDDVPKGLDYVREAIEESKERGVLVKVPKKDIIAAKFGGERLFSVRGGWEDVRQKLQGDPELLTKFIDALNADSMREKSR